MCRVFAFIFSLLVIIHSTYAYDWGTNPGDGSVGNPYQISSAEQLVAIGSDPVLLDKNYILMNDINMDPNVTGIPVFTTAVIAPDIDPNYYPFDGIPFTGTFDGNGLTISNLTIDASMTGNDYLGLFGYIDDPKAHVKNLGLENLNISTELSIGSNACCGGVCGGNKYGWISNCYVTGSIRGGGEDDNLGGLCGLNYYGSITHCHTTNSVSGGSRLGGLCGLNTYGTITNSYSTGSVTGSENADYLGGLCGNNAQSSNISLCYAMGSVTSGKNSEYVGGLCGYNAQSSNISFCYAMGSVTGTYFIGGLCGYNGTYGYCNINYCYATGCVIGYYYLGGLCGKNAGGIISNCYSTGSITGVNYLGGFCGENTGSISYCYFLDTVGINNEVGTPLTDSQMREQASFVGWDFVEETANGTSSWWIIHSEEYPSLYILDPNFVPHEFWGEGTEQKPYLIYDPNDLGAIWQQPDSYYRLEYDLDLSDISWSNAVIPDFRGVFNGNGYAISHLTIAGGCYLGLCGTLRSSATVINLGLENINITGGDDSLFVGGLCGENYGNIANCYATGVVIGGVDSQHLGELCGSNNYGNIRNCYTTGSVSGGNNSYGLGGLCGMNYHGNIIDCDSVTSVTGYQCLGGLCGYNMAGHIIHCYSTGSVTGYLYLGGFSGRNSGWIRNCYASGLITGYDYLGGLCGDNYNSIINSYATGPVTGGPNSFGLGGLCGVNIFNTLSIRW